MKSETAQQLQTALAVAKYASPALIAIATAAAAAAGQQIAAATGLRDATTVKGGGDGATAMGILSTAIRAAAQFAALEDEVEAAEALQERWGRRAEAVAKLDLIMHEVR